MQKLSLRSRGKYETKPSGKSLWTRMNNKVRDFLASMCFSGPSFLGMLAFYIIPFLIVIYYSFTVGLTDHSFAGLKNYINVWQNGAFKIAVKNTFTFTGMSVPLAGAPPAWGVPMAKATDSNKAHLHSGVDEAPARAARPRGRPPPRSRVGEITARCYSPCGVNLQAFVASAASCAKDTASAATFSRLSLCIVGKWPPCGLRTRNRCRCVTGAALRRAR